MCRSTSIRRQAVSGAQRAPITAVDPFSREPHANKYRTDPLRIRCRTLACQRGRTDSLSGTARKQCYHLAHHTRCRRDLRRLRRRRRWQYCWRAVSAAPCPAHLRTIDGRGNIRICPCGRYRLSPTGTAIPTVSERVDIRISGTSDRVATSTGNSRTCGRGRSRMAPNSGVGCYRRCSAELMVR